jgi:hypothetical protein
MNFFKKKKHTTRAKLKGFFIKNLGVNQYLNERIDKLVIDKKLDFRFRFDYQFFET